jgi:hypothetical protein
MLQDEYDKYVFELQEMHPEAVPMSIEQFKQQAVSSMANGGIMRLGYANGQLVQPGLGRPGYGGVDWDEGGDTPMPGGGHGSGHEAATGGGQDHDWSNDIGTVGTTYTPPPPRPTDDGPPGPPVTTGITSITNPAFKKHVAKQNFYANLKKGPSMDVSTRQWYDADGNPIDNPYINPELASMVKPVAELKTEKILGTEWAKTPIQWDDIETGRAIGSQKVFDKLKADPTINTWGDLYQAGLSGQIEDIGGAQIMTRNPEGLAALGKEMPYGMELGKHRSLGDLEVEDLYERIPGAGASKYHVNVPLIGEEKTRGTFGLTGRGKGDFLQKDVEEKLRAEGWLAEGGIARLGYANGQLVQPGPGRPGYQGRPGGFEETKAAGESYAAAKAADPQRGAEDWQEDALQQHRIQQEARGEGEKQRKYEAEAKAYQEAKEKKEKKEEKEKEELSWWDKKRAESAKKSLKKLMVHKMRGSPITFPSILGAFKGPMSDKDFEEKYGMSYEDFANINPMHMEAIFGSVKDKVSQAERDDIRRISGGLGSENLHKQDVWEDIYYGDKGPPQPGGGGDGPEYLPKKLVLPDETPDEETPDDDDDIPTGPINASGIASTYNLTGVGDMYGYLPPSGAGTTYKPITNTYGELTYGAADGGRVPAAYGGRMGYAGGGDIRQRYLFGGLGKLFKGITKPFKGITRGIKKLTKSKAGKMAIMAALMGAPFGGGPGATWFGKGSGWGALTGGGKGPGIMGNIKKMIMGTPIRSMTSEGARNYTKGGLWNWIKDHPWQSTGFGLGLLSLLDKGGDENDMWNKWLAEKQAQDEHWIPRFDPSNFRRIEFSADGGRIGYDRGGYLHDDEEDTDYARAIRALSYRPRAQEGGLMNLGGMEKDYRNDGGFVPIGGQERADDVPARLSKNEFVFTADAVRAAGGGDIDAGAEIMENVMENLEQGGEISQQSQGLEGARDMFATSQRLEGVL